MDQPAQRRSRGRPPKFHEGIPKQAGKLSIAGWTDEQMAGFFEVALSTFNRWKSDYPEFRDALRKKGQADADVEASLYQRALGYSHPDVHISMYQGVVTQTPIIKHYPPEPVACIFWLKNRQPDRWREKPSEGNASTPEESATAAQEAIVAALATNGRPE